MSDVDKAKQINFPPIDDAKWHEIAEASLKGKGTFESRLVSKTLDGFKVQPLYSHRDKDSGYPGQAPFTRGSKPLRSADQPWEIRQEYAHPNLKTTNAQMLRDLQRGVSGISLVFDDGFRRGTDEATNVGLPLRSVKDFTSTVDGVHLNMVGLALKSGIHAHGALALLAGHLQNIDAPLTDIHGTLGFNPYDQLLQDGTLPIGTSRIFDLGADLVVWARANAPGLRPILVSGTAVQHAGATEGQEIAWALAAGIEWMRELTQRGISADDAADGIAFSTTAARDIFLEVAKLRALRQTWARALEEIGVTEAHRAMDLNARSSSATLTQRDPWVNMLRATGHTYSGALGGAQSITTASYDEALATPVRFGRRIARNTQLILRDESHMLQVQDPVGGSYYFEAMTMEYAQVAWTTMQQIESAGGAIAWAQSGGLNDAVNTSRNQRDAKIATRAMPLTGVSEYPNLHEKAVETPETPFVSPATGGAKASRTQRAIQAGVFDGSIATAAIKDAQDGVLSGAIFAAITAGGSAITAPAMPIRRYAALWEALRDAADRYKSAHDDYPQAFLACVGRIPEHRARATFSQNLFAAAGIDAPVNDGWLTIDETVQAFVESKRDVACICSTDAHYNNIVPELAAALTKAGAREILVAGNPREHQDAWRKAGVSAFIYKGCQALDIMRDVLVGFGVQLHD